MPEVKTGIEGSATFPANSNDVYGLIETLSIQEIENVKSANKIIDGFREYEVDNGKVIEQSIIEMASAQAFDKNSYNFSATDPTVRPKYYNNFVPKQFKTTIRRDDIRAIIANKGVGVEDVVARILDTLTQGDGNYDFTQCRDLLYKADFVNYRSIIGGVPADMKGVIYALRDMYNHLICNNDDLTEAQFVSATPEADVRIALSPKVLNLMDVKEWATIFNMSKEELFGKIVKIDVDDLSDHTYDYFCYVYDVKALGRATRLYEWSQDIIGVGRYNNYYLTVERAYFHNGLFKGCYLDCTEACTTAKATIITTPTSYTVTKTLSHATTDSTVASVYQNEAYKATFVASAGYTLTGATVSVTMGGTDITTTAYKDGVVSIPHVTGNLAISITAVSA